MKAVRFDGYGGIEVLQVVEVPTPEPSQGEVLVKVKAAAINPGEAKIRQGLLHSRWPATFPSGEGSDLAGIVSKVGPGVADFKAGDEVLGFTDRRASHAEFVVVEAKNLASKPHRGIVGSRRRVADRRQHCVCGSARGQLAQRRYRGNIGRRGWGRSDRRAARGPRGRHGYRHCESRQP